MLHIISRYHIYLYMIPHLLICDKRIDLLHIISRSFPTHKWHRIWNGYAISLFTTKSAYKFISHTTYTKLAFDLEIKAPLRVVIFSWLLLNNRLLSTNNLIKRGWILPSMCYLCRQHQESASHIFTQCP
jgi:zinc-binding in reverse transcriptase